MVLIPQKAALILIDIQRGFDDPQWGHRNNPDAETNAAALLQAWRQTGRPLFHVQHLSQDAHSPLRAGSPGSEIKEIVLPQAGEPVIQKHVNSAFIGTDLEDRLRCEGITTLIIVRLTTNHCVETTARMAGNLGFLTYVVSDATATFDRRGSDGVLHPAALPHQESDFAFFNKHPSGNIVTFSTLSLLHQFPFAHETGSPL